jgi:DNA-directed RNA polymerase alpha subunit
MTNDVIQVDAKGVFRIANDLKTQLDKLPISVRLRKGLRRAGIFTVEQLARTNDLSGIRNMGRTSIKEAAELLARTGITAKWDDDGYPRTN